MRTIVDFDADTANAIERFRRDSGMGLSEAVNELVRRGLLPRSERQTFIQPTAPLGLRIDVSNVANAIDRLDGTGSA